MSVSIKQPLHVHQHKTRQSLSQKLTELCAKLQKRVDRYSLKRRRYLEDESGLKIINTLSCPEKVLLLPASSFKFLLNQMTAHPKNLNTVHGQADFIAEHLSIEDVIELNNILDKLLKKLDKNIPDRQLINTLARKLCQSEITKDIRELEREEDFLAVYRHHYPNPMQSPYCHSILADNDDQDLNDSFPKTHNEVDHTLITQYLRSFHPKIEYYALRILGVSSTLGVITTHLLDVIQIHELAHFVSHLGIDNEAYIWFNFEKASKHLVEGIAQDLTRRILQRQSILREFESKSISPTCMKQEKAFKALNRNQSAPYRIHLDWEVNYPSIHDRYIAFQVFRSKLFIIHDEKNFAMMMHRVGLL